MESASQKFRDGVHRVLHAFIGLVFLTVAGLLLFAPLASYAAVALIFGIAVLFTGILEMLYAIFFRQSLQGWGWHLVAGLLDVAIGLYLNAYPMVSLTLIPYLAGFWLIWRGLTLCGYASMHRPTVWAEWVFGVGAVLWGLVILWWPAEGVMTVVYFLAVAFALMGTWRFIFAFRGIKRE